MKLRHFIFILSGIFCAAAFAGEPQDGLWQKAVGFASASKEAKVVPGTFTMSTVVKKKDGTVESTSTLKFRTVDKGDDVDAELISAVEDGKDVTAEARKQNEEEKKNAKPKQEGSGEGSVSLSLGEHPFGPEIQKDVKVLFRSQTMVDGTAASLFTFVQKSGDGKSVTKGRAWLDSSTGMPLKIESATEPLPDHVENMTTTTTFTKTPEGLWVAASSIIAGEGGFLWMHFSSETKVQFSDFRISKAKAGG